MDSRGTDKEGSLTPDTERPSSTRTLRACDACRSKKIKCDAGEPACDGCRHAKIQCTYLRPHRKRKLRRETLESRPEHPHVLASRVAELEKTVDRLTNTLGRSTTDILSAILPRKTPNSPDGRGFVRVARGIGSIGSYIKYPLMSKEAGLWVKSISGEDVDFRAMLEVDLKPENDSGEQHGPPPLDPYSMKLPSREVLEERAAMHFSSTAKHIVPLLDYDIFANTIDAVYGSKDNRKDDPVRTVSGKARILTFLAYMSRCSEHDASMLEVDGETCFKAALRLLPEIVSEEATIEACESVICMCAYQASFGVPYILEQLVSTAVRMLYTLGGHVRPTSENMDPSWTNSRLRNLFWATYAFDKDICMRTLHPPSINDDECDLDLPIAAPTNYLQVKPEKLSFYSNDLQLARLKSQIYRNLYSAIAKKKHDTQLLKDVRELDEELDAWRAQLPPLCRPERNYVEITDVVAQNLRLFLLHLEYYQCLIMIHRASTRCSIWNNDYSHGLNAIESSVALCLEACRSTIHYMDASRNLVGSDNVWVVSHYAFSSILTIFCNLLEHPKDPRSRQDYELIRGAPHVISELMTSTVSKEETTHLRLTLTFLIEILRVAKCCIDRAANS